MSFEENLSSSTAEKAELERTDEEAKDADSLSVAEEVSEWKVMAKIDCRVVVMLVVMYVFAFLDRVNIGNAALFGLKDDLHLGGNEYNTALVIFFVPYIFFEILSNALMKHFRPHVWLSGCMLLFGITTCLQGLTQNYSGILATRFFLGLFECGMFPGGLYLLAMWYRREDALKRCAFFFGSNNLAGAFGGLLATAIGKMDGMRGFRAWRWVFILEGALSCVVAVLLFFLIADFPEEATWLTPAEKAFVKIRLKEDVGSSQRDERITIKFALSVISDYKVIAAGFMYLGLITPAYGYAYFAPTIIQSLGHSAIQSQLLSVPPWVCAFVLAISIAVFSDRLRHRFLFAVVPMALALAGFSALVATGEGGNERNLKYGALYLAACGTFSAMPVVLCWFTTNLAGHRRRAIAIAWQVGFGNVGGIVSAYAFLAQDAPRYITGYSLCIAFVCVSALASCIYLVGCIWENRRRSRNAPFSDGLSVQEKESMGDLNPDYRYLY
ncbi:hypothetical protein EIP91_006723 [Steccherinum ochraceum]|uniref:Major facilitator superfamily (MFS) profile domain-containing protein n=1 Tax=Steccherinum ochraceum TaxID=92696 RepID=A0A4R0R809_9APHY|nr:hypothetical protein EIP91_006723 [Steccherinum ochraceum]